MIGRKIINKRNKRDDARREKCRGREGERRRRGEEGSRKKVVEQEGEGG